MAYEQHPKSNNFKTALTIAGTKVVGTQEAVIADATDAASAITQVNAVIAALRAHGLIATA